MLGHVLPTVHRRCEDICWVKTNTKNPGNTHHLDQKAILQNVKEHCLMGIKGTVRRNQDGHFIHANIDLDIIITEEVGHQVLWRRVSVPQYKSSAQTSRMKGICPLLALSTW